MLNLLKSARFRAARNKAVYSVSRKSTIDIPTNTPFQWKAGLCMSPRQSTTIVFPGTLVNENETIGAVIEVSDDNAEIGFAPSSEQEQPFNNIVVRLRTGVQLRLRRASEAVALAETDVVQFDVELDDTLTI